MRYEKFGERLRAARGARGLTQQRLATDVGVSIGTLNRWEAGQQKPTLKHVEELAAHLHVAPEYLAFGVKGARAS